MRRHVSSSGCRSAVGSACAWANPRGARTAGTLTRSSSPGGEYIHIPYPSLAVAICLQPELPVPWREIARACRLFELRGDVRGGRFVSGFSGEQFALPEAVPLLRKIRKEEPGPELTLSAADPLNLEGVLTPGERVPTSRSEGIVVRG